MCASLGARTRVRLPWELCCFSNPQLVREQGDSWEIVLVVVTPLVVGTRCLTGTRKEEFGVLFVKLTFLFFNYFFFETQNLVINSVTSFHES